MRHLSADTLVDLAEGSRLESAEPHLRECDECRRQVTKLRGVLMAVGQVSVPEPSPLFWDHFTERVRRAVTQEALPRRTSWNWLSRAESSGASPIKTVAPWLAVAAIA